MKLFEVGKHPYFEMPPKHSIEQTYKSAFVMSIFEYGVGPGIGFVEHLKKTGVYNFYGQVSEKHRDKIVKAFFDAENFFQSKTRQA